MQKIAAKVAACITKSPMPSKVFPSRNWAFDNQLSKDLKPGDIILYRDKHNYFPSNVIKLFTASPYPHVEIHLIEGYDISATATGVGYVDLSRAEFVDVLRYKRELTREERLIIFAKAAQSVLKPYDYGNLFFFPFISKKLAIKLSANKSYICSELTDWIYNEANLKLFGSKEIALISPADFGLCKNLNYIGTYLNGSKIEGDFRNKTCIEEENGKDGIRITAFLEAVSTRDEYYRIQKALWEKINK